MKKNIIIATIIIVVILTSILIKYNKGQEELSVFFIKTDDNKYLLYDELGNQINNYSYDNVLDFIHNSTLVYQDNKVYIIDIYGNTLVNSNEYDELTRYASFYKGTKDNKEYLLDSNGKVIRDITDNEIVSFKGAENYLILDNKDIYEIILYNGKTIYKYNKNKDMKPTVNQLDNLSSIHYNDTTIIFDINNGNIKYEINSNYHYCIKEINKDKILLNTCSKNYIDNISYKLIDKDIIDLPNKCSNISFKGNNILCEYNDKKYLLDNEYNIDLDVTNNINYIDNNNYIRLNKDKVDIYKDKKKIDTIDNAYFDAIGYQRSDYYIINIDNYYYYYDISGNKVFDLKFDKANYYDDNNLAIITDNNYQYLIDKKGNKVTNELDNIEAFKDFYIITKDNSKGLLNNKGNKVLDTIYDTIDLIYINNHNYALLTKENRYIIYDIDSKKIIDTYQDKIEVFNYYYKVGNKYYTFNGKNIY